MRGTVFCSALLCAVLLCGCWSGNDRQTIYDWRAPAPRADLMLKCGSFRNFSSADLAFRYQQSDGTVIVDPYRRWAQSPEHLLRTYLMNAFAGAKTGEKTAQIDCTIFEYRADLGKEVCSLGVEYTLKQEKETRTRVFRTEKPFRKNDPASISEAFTAAAEELVQDIAAAAK